MLRALFAVVLFIPLSSLGDLEPDSVFLDNGVIRLGVDKSSGAGIFYFAESKRGRNLLNHYDRGRFIQQSYYGRADGSKWNGKPWRWNPVQGGNWKGKPSRLLSFRSTRTTLHSVTVPHHWAADHLIEGARMEQSIELHGPLAHLRFRFRSRGATAHPARHQEMPAVFMDAALPNLAFYNGDAPWTGAPLTRVVPGWPNELRTATEHWAAYLDNDDWGCGVFFPSTGELTTYRHPGPAGPMGAGCSYFAPVRTLAIGKEFQLEYHAYLTIGPVAEIRRRFAAIREEKKPAPGP